MNNPDRVLSAAAPPTKKDKPGKPGDADREDDLKGRARWIWTLRDEKGTLVDRDTFTGYQSGEIVHAKKRIGTWRPGGPNKVR